LEDNISVVLKKTGWGVVDWIRLAQTRDQWWAFLKMEMNLQVPWICKWQFLKNNCDPCSQSVSQSVSCSVR